MTNAKLQKFIYTNQILVDELGNAYIVPTKSGYKFSPIKEKELEKCVVITKDELIGLLERTLVFNPTTQKCEAAPVRNLYKAEKARIKELKQLLAETDYQAIKYAEGVLSYSEYEPVRLQRIAWREEINSLEAIING